MTLLYSWRDSLAVFKPSNFKLFLLVTLKSLGMTYKVWLKYWWWLIVGILGLITFTKLADEFISLIILTAPIISFRFLLTTIPGISLICMLALIYSSLFLSARASMQLKNGSYFLGYAKYILYVIAWFFLLFYLNRLQDMLLNMRVGDVGLIFVIIEWWLYLLLLSGTTLFFMLFLFDSDGSIVQALQSLWRGFKMTLYNLPGLVLLSLILFAFLLMIGTLFQGIIALIKMLHISYDSGIIRSFLYVTIFLPILVNFVTNFYIKRVHEQFNLYYGK